jgi:cell division protein FtsB
MSNRFIPALLIFLAITFHAQIWFGRGSVWQVSQMRNKLSELKDKAHVSQQNNDRLNAEIRDLKEGLEMVEEKARSELGMVKSNEILVQYTR